MSTKPDEVLAALIAASSHAKHKEVLKALHHICAGQAATSRDFSRPTLRRLIDAQGRFAGRILYNSSSSDLLELIAAWEEFAGKDGVQASTAQPAPYPHHNLLIRIPDVAVRSVVQAKLMEFERAKQELALLKSKLNLHVDLRPVQVAHSDSKAVPLLSPSEREALAASISEDTLGKEGWTIGAHGELRNKAGRAIFRPGFAQAVRKILAT